MEIKQRWQKLLISVTSCILILLIIVSIGGIFFLKPLVAARIKKSVSNATDKLYHLSFSDIQYNPALGNLVISDVHFLPDTLIYNKLHALKKAPDDLLLLQVPTIKITNISPLAIFFTKILDINTVRVEHPTITVLHKNQPYNIKVDSAERKTPYQLISKFVKSLKINSVLLNNVDFTYENQQHSKPTKSIIQNLYVEITNVLVDSLAAKSTRKIYYADNYTFRIKEIVLPDKNHLNDNLLKGIEFSLKKQQLTISQYHLKPRTNEMTFGKVSGGDDRAEILFNNIVISGIQPQMLFPDNKLYANALALNGGYVKVFNDKRYAGKKRNKVGEYPHQLLKKLKLKLNIDTISINNTRVSYAEYDPETKLTGSISFDRINGKILNVTNDSLPLLKNPVCEAQFHTYFMNTGSLNVSFSFNNISKKGDFTCRGELGYFEGTSINNTTVALAKISVQSLQVNKYVFKLKGDDHRITGTGILYYQNLKATILKAGTTQNENKRRFRLFKKRHVHTFLVNNLVLKDANPNKNNTLKVGTIDFARVPTKSFWSTIWGGLSQSLFQCVTGTTKE